MKTTSRAAIGLLLAGALAAGSVTAAHAEATVAISGQALTAKGESLGQGAVEVTAYAKSGTSWAAHTTVRTATDGTYRITGLDAGDYKVGFHVVSTEVVGYIDEFWDDAANLDQARVASVEPGELFENVDAYLASIFPDGRYPTTTHLALDRGAITEDEQAVISGQVTANARVDRGTVSLRDNGSLIATQELSAGAGVHIGSFSFTLPRLAPGTHTITASYEGRSVFAPSVSVVQPLQVSKRPPAASVTTVKVVKKPTRKKKGSARITVASATAPTGVIVVFDGRKRLLAKAITTGSSVSVKLPKLKRGTHKIRAVYYGSSTVAASTSTVSKFRVR